MPATHQAKTSLKSCEAVGLGAGIALIKIKIEDLDFDEWALMNGQWENF